MRILGIETSCDDTGIGIVSYAKGKFTIEATVTASQVLVHRKYGGVVPEVAAREHALTIIPTYQAAMKKAGVRWKDIDAIAVTGGPGLNTALMVGVETARTLSWIYNIPVVRTNHIEGHVCSTWASPDWKNITFPAVALIVSGGHTELILIKNIGQYSLLGRTLDDAVGEAFDKVAKMLGLSYPGGPEISKQALLGSPNAIKFPVSMLGPNNLDFSYSGLKTSVLYKLQEHRSVSKKPVNDIAASFQAAAIKPLVLKSALALKKTGAKALILAGGVAANKHLRESLAEMIEQDHPKTSLVQAPLELCMDNGTMIAMAGIFHAQKKDFTPWKKLDADPNWELV